MRDYEPYFTEDGSVGLYSYADKDVYHSKFGALTEAWEKFILPANIDINNINELKVLDICYGIGYNTKALMSFVINNLKRKKENFIKKFFKKIFTKCYNIVSVGINKFAKKNIELLVYNDTIDDNKNILIDCLDINEELVKLSPFFKTLKTPEEIYESLVPNILSCFDTYYSLEKLFVKVASNFYPKNRKEITELLELKFKSMHIEKEYKINPYVNYILLNSLYEYYKKLENEHNGNGDSKEEVEKLRYMNKELKKILTNKKNRRYFDKSCLNYAKFNQFWGYNKSSKYSLSTFLHNIYYNHLSKRYKKIKFKAAQRLFNVNFHIKDARKTILSLNNEYDLIFLDAFTYTKAPQLWSIEFIAELYKRISPSGLLLTYSNSAQVRNTLLENKFYVGKIIDNKTNKVIGTIASKDKSKIKNPLSTYDIGLCNTKAGIPYHDPNLSFDSKDIIELREYEFRHSDLMSSSKYMKIRSLRNDE